MILFLKNAGGPKFLNLNPNLVKMTQQDVYGKYYYSFFRLMAHYPPHYQTESSNFNKQNENNKKTFNINDRFILKSQLSNGGFYKAYKGIDLIQRKFVTIYLKPNSKEKLFSKNIKLELREKISPPLKWSGTQKIDKKLFDVEVYARYGPSLDEIMKKYKQKISDKTLYLLIYHSLKLLDKIDNSGFVIRNLSTKNIVFSESPKKNDLFLLNTFDFERKNQQVFSPYGFKYCSIGAHLKLKTSAKDTLQSMCYVLMDFYMKGTLFLPYLQKQKQFLEAKNMIRMAGIPILLIEFYQYVKNLNHNQQIKYTEWKAKFKKNIPQQEFFKPYQWIQKGTSSLKNKNSIFTQNSQQNSFLKVAEDSSNFKFQKMMSDPLKSEQSESQLVRSDDDLEFDEDNQSQFDEGDFPNNSTVQEKFMTINQSKFHSC